jgi:sulfotransferase family protein
MHIHGNTTKGSKSNRSDSREPLLANSFPSIAKAKSLVPPEQLLCLRLEDGMDWDKICPFLVVPVPDAEWPSKHEADEFSKGVDSSTSPMLRNAMSRMIITASVIVGVVAFGSWNFRRK